MAKKTYADLKPRPETDAKDPSTILLIIDMEPRYQNKQMPGGLTWRQLNKDVANIHRDFVRHGIDAIHVALDLNGTPKLGSHDEIERHLVATRPPGIGPSPVPMFDYPVAKNAIVAIKTRASVETCPPLTEHLKARGYKNIVLIGNAEQIDSPDREKSCVSASADFLRGQGYHVTIDANGTNAARVPIEQRRARHPGISITPHAEALEQLHARKSVKVGTYRDVLLARVTSSMKPKIGHDGKA